MIYKSCINILSEQINPSKIRIKPEQNLEEKVIPNENCEFVFADFRVLVGRKWPELR